MMGGGNTEKLIISVKYIRNIEVGRKDKNYENKNKIFNYYYDSIFFSANWYNKC